MREVIKMFKQVSLSLASVMVLAACAGCATHPALEGDAAAASLNGVDSASIESESMMTGTASGDVDRTQLAILGENTVSFAFDSAALDERSQMILRGVAKKIKMENPERVVVEGHCDERGTREYNLALGDRRAVSAKKFLVGLGVDAEKITTISYGKERPLDAAHNAKAWAKNRRASVIFE